MNLFRLAVIVLMLCFASVAEAKSIVITIDDLPGRRAPTATAKQSLEKIANILVKYHVPATGFVIGELATRSPENTTAIENWANAGLSLGNHTWTHRKYSALSVDEYLLEIQKTEEFLRRFRKQADAVLTFRFPMLNQGDTKEKEDAINKYLQKTNTLLAHVSVDTSDWARDYPL
jgi:peptidoglycan/xylan/chitin deacetylase (PgdA/CDA1 family)